MMLAILGHGTYRVMKQFLTLAMPRQISDSNDVLQVYGIYWRGFGRRYVLQIRSLNANVSHFSS
jgi:hypothetical protein